MPPRKRKAAPASSGKAKAARQTAEESEGEEETEQESQNGAAGKAKSGGAARAATQSLSAKAALAKLSKKERDAAVATIVRWILFRHSSYAHITLSDITQQVAGKNEKLAKAIKPLFAKACSQLLDVFGMELVMLPAPEGKDQLASIPDTRTDAIDEDTKLGAAAKLCLVNALDIDASGFTCASPKQTAERGLLFIVLSLIYMNALSLEESKLWSELKAFQVYKDKSHAVMGNVTELLENIWSVRQRYLTRRREHGPNGPQFQYRWGPRAKAECSATDVVSFMASVYGEDPVAWLEKMGLVEEEVL